MKKEKDVKQSLTVRLDREERDIISSLQKSLGKKFRIGFNKTQVISSALRIAKEQVEKDGGEAYVTKVS